ncbi:hypothetical protein [Sphingobacterium bovistauri]|uniref:Lipoprotein n=1 Tax=Sphingobacterium bovistauri TaxID=2781959 RepID=A0ABS7ZC94_9SPHI|nr:hypothetical protein [Sphingobacterium bovistauri]MCA5006344.1 hypothetical protein [Sphingobacterium bovistauri]
MKKLIYFFFVLLFVSCKEDEITPNINFDSPYVIEDDPENAVNHKRYLLYQEYGVPVYFSDTVNTVYITKNIHGDSVFNYEMLDLNWGFSSVGAIDYTYDYITKEEERLLALNNIEKYLQSSLPNMRPFSIFLVDKFEAEGNNEVVSLDDLSAPAPRNKVTSVNTYRTLVVSQAHKTYSTDFWSKYSLTLLKSQLQKIITGEAYKTKVIGFQSVSNVTYFDKYYLNLGVNMTGFTPVSWRNFNYNNVYTGALATTYAKIISVFGQFGFIGLSTTTGIWYSPNIATDRNLYIEAILSYNQETFERVWGNSPLVMEKYRIMHDIIENDMQIPLDEIVK